MADDQKTAHDVIAYFFDRPVKDMGGGLRIIELPQKWMDAEWADLIRRAVKHYAQSTHPTQGQGSAP